MRRIMIIHPEGNINNNPNLSGIVQILCEEGYQVDVYSIRFERIDQSDPCPGARLITTEGTTFFTQIPQDAFQDELTFHSHLDRLPRYDLIIGVDRGIIEASLIAGRQQVPYGLISYEILFAEEAGAGSTAFDRDASQGVAFAVCQDRERSSHLSRENGIALNSIIDIPVAGRGERPHRPSPLLREMLGIAPDKKIALYIGSVGDRWSGFDELLAGTDDWPEEWVLVLHERYSRYSEELVAKLRDKKKGNVYLSPLLSLPFSELYRLLDAADLGVCFYVPQFQAEGTSDRNNIKYIGMSSGKTTTYLQHGLPILINEVGEMSMHVREQNFGMVTDDLRGIGRLLGQMTRARLDEMSGNAIRFFRERLDLEVTAAPLLHAVSRLLGEEFPPQPRTTLRPAPAAPRISLVIPSYNYGCYLEACLDSILTQNYPNLELIVLDGGSTDNTVEILKRYQRHISFWRSAPDHGQYSAIEEGLNLSTGEVMAWLNADDMFHKEAFGTVGRIFSRFPEVEWLMGRPNSFDESGKEKHVLSFLPLNSRAKYLRDEELIQQEGVFWRRALWERSGAYIDKTLPLAADLELWARFFRSARLFSVNALIAGFRDHPLQKSKDKAGYTAEASRVLSRERALFNAEQNPFNPPAPLPILVQGDEVIL